MMDLHKDRFERFKRAANLFQALMESSGSSWIRRAEEAGCLFEFEYICEDIRLWCNDDEYFDDVAWNLEYEQVS